MMPEDRIEEVLEAICREVGVEPVEGRKRDRFLSKKEALQILTCVRQLKFRVERKGGDEPCYKDSSSLV